MPMAKHCRARSSAVGTPLMRHRRCPIFRRTVWRNSKSPVLSLTPRRTCGSDQPVERSSRRREPHCHDCRRPPRYDGAAHRLDVAMSPSCSLRHEIRWKEQNSVRALGLRDLRHLAGQGHARCHARDDRKAMRARGGCRDDALVFGERKREKLSRAGGGKQRIRTGRRQAGRCEPRTA